ncbi:MAG TPA: hypothetical protein VGN61_10005 [Verrucomicrobiae bacterium]|jgi:hypothetical protein
MKCTVPFVVAWCLVATALKESAAPLQLADLPADPACVLHVDCDALRRAYIGQYLLYQLNKPQLHSNLVAFASFVSFDFRTQLHGLTIYGVDSSADDNVAIFYADLDTDRLTRLFKAAEAARISTNNNHVIYSWINGGVRNFAVVESNRLVSSKSRESVIANLGVIDGTSPDFSKSKTLPNLPAASDTALVQGVAGNLDFVTGPHAALFKLSKWATLQANEVDEHLRATLTLKLGDEETAKQAAVVVLGLIAQLSLQPDNPKAANLAGGMAVKQSGTTVTVTLAVPSLELIEALKVASAKKDNP